MAASIVFRSGFDTDQMPPVFRILIDHAESHRLDLMPWRRRLEMAPMGDEPLGADSYGAVALWRVLAQSLQHDAGPWVDDAILPVQVIRDTGS